MPVMRNPLRTKNNWTPIQPRCRATTNRYAPPDVTIRLRLCGTTRRTAIARRPSRLGKRAGVGTECAGPAFRGLTCSLDADVPLAYDLSPFLRFALEVGRELLRSARDDLESHLLEEARLLRRSQGLLEPGVEQRNDRRGLGLGREHPVPGGELVPGQPALGDGLRLVQRGRA